MWKSLYFLFTWTESEGLGSCKNREDKILYGLFTYFCEAVTTTKFTLSKDKGAPLHVEHL